MNTVLSLFKLWSLRGLMPQRGLSYTDYLQGEGMRSSHWKNTATFSVVLFLQSQNFSTTDTQQTVTPRVVCDDLFKNAFYKME